MQFHQKFPNVTVAVGEERIVAIPQLLHEKPDTDVIILDDAFQHRQVRAGLNILLTEFSKPYVNDEILPAGNLRDNISSASRAHIIIVTKCPGDIGTEEKLKLTKKLHPKPTQSVFFTKIVYASPVHLFSRQAYSVSRSTGILLICGIANPVPLVTYLKESFDQIEVMQFSDHHIFRSDDLLNIKKNFEKLDAHPKIILTTEKDGVRLEKFKAELEEFPIYVLPIRHQFLFGEEQVFSERVERFVREIKRG